MVMELIEGETLAAVAGKRKEGTVATEAGPTAETSAVISIDLD